MENLCRAKSTKLDKMKSVIFILCATLSVCLAQNNVDWTQVRRIHEAPAFFEDFPYLQALFPMYNVVNLNETEGHTSTRNQFNYIVSLLCNVESNEKTRKNLIMNYDDRLDWR